MKLDYPTSRRLGADFDLDPRTPRREAEHPGSVKGLAGDRARRALAWHAAQVAPAVPPSPVARPRPAA
jgi:hypothetical protein